MSSMSTTKKTRTSSANGTRGSGWITRPRRLALYLRDGFRCQYCGADLAGAPAERLTLDHLTAGHADHRDQNLVLACLSCNSARQDKPWRRYATGGAVERIVRQRRKSIARFLALAREILRGGTEWGTARTRAAELRTI